EFKGPAMRQGRTARAQWDYGPTNVAVPHAGSVEIGARVEIQANSTVDRSLFRLATRIGDDTKIDNLVHVAHSVRIGARCVLAAGFTLAEHGERVTVLEAQDFLGGLATTLRGSTNAGYDFGPHAYHARNQRVLDLFKEIASDGFPAQAKNVRIKFRGKYYKY